jgi:hypothetical protein
VRRSGRWGHKKKLDFSTALSELFPLADLSLTRLGVSDLRLANLELYVVWLIVWQIQIIIEVSTSEE